MKEFKINMVLRDDGSLGFSGSYLDNIDALDDPHAQLTAIGMLDLVKASIIARRWKLLDAKTKQDSDHA